MKRETPWGQSQWSENLAEGVEVHSTASHGGVFLSPERNEIVPAYMRAPNGWYEEDCDWAIPAVVFPEIFTPLARSNAEQSLRHWRPEAAAKWFGGQR